MKVFRLNISHIHCILYCPMLHSVTFNNLNSFMVYFVMKGISPNCKPEAKTSIDYLKTCTFSNDECT